MRIEITISLIVIIAIFGILGYLALKPVLAQLQTAIGVEDTLSPTDDRKAFSYCPISSDTENILGKYGVSYNIEGCPLSRLYVDNWDKLDKTTQQNIVNELLASGYRMDTE